MGHFDLHPNTILPTHPSDRAHHLTLGSRTRPRGVRLRITRPSTIDQTLRAIPRDPAPDRTRNLVSCTTGQRDHASRITRGTFSSPRVARHRPSIADPSPQSPIPRNRTIRTITPRPQRARWVHLLYLSPRRRICLKEDQRRHRGRRKVQGDMSPLSAGSAARPYMDNLSEL